MQMKKLFVYLTCLLGIMAIGANSGFAAPVDVKGEVAYNEDALVMFIFATMNTQPVLSFGVAVAYDDAALDFVSASKNTAVWYMGAGTEEYPYMDPENSADGTDGKVIVIGGKLDTNAPTAGVSGSRVLLGKVYFSHDGSTMPPPIPTLSYGRMDESVTPPVLGAYVNFADVTGAPMDGAVGFSTEAHEFGDANGDGSIDGLDVRELRLLIGSDNLPPWCDCNNDGSVDGLDIRWLRLNI